MKGSPIDWLVYALLRGVIGILGLLSWERAGRLGAGIGALGYRPLGIRRRVVETQIAESFPELPPDEVRRIARGAYQNLGRLTVETALLPKLHQEDVLAMLERIEGVEHIERARQEGGFIFVTGHLGNWEFCGAAAAALGVPLDAVARKINNPLVHDYVTRTREALGISIVFDRQAVRRTPKALKEGRAVAFLADQSLLKSASVWVPFFGRLAKTPRGPATFALRLGVPILFGAVIRQPDGRFVGIVEPIPVEDTGDADRDVERIVARYTRVLEHCVRRAPEQYFWHHRRWKRSPPGQQDAKDDDQEEQE